MIILSLSKYDTYYNTTETIIIIIQKTPIYYYMAVTVPTIMIVKPKYQNRVIISSINAANPRDFAAA